MPTTRGSAKKASAEAFRSDSPTTRAEALRSDSPTTRSSAKKKALHRPSGGPTLHSSSPKLTPAAEKSTIDLPPLGASSSLAKKKTPRTAGTTGTKRKGGGGRPPLSLSRASSLSSAGSKLTPALDPAETKHTRGRRPPLSGGASSVASSGGSSVSSTASKAPTNRIGIAMVDKKLYIETRMVKPKQKRIYRPSSKHEVEALGQKKKKYHMISDDLQQFSLPIEGVPIDNILGEAAGEILFFSKDCREVLSLDDSEFDRKLEISGSFLLLEYLYKLGLDLASTSEDLPGDLLKRVLTLVKLRIDTTTQELGRFKFQYSIDLAGTVSKEHGPFVLDEDEHEGRQYALRKLREAWKPKSKRNTVDPSTDNPDTSLPSLVAPGTAAAGQESSPLVAKETAAAEQESNGAAAAAAAAASATSNAGDHQQPVAGVHPPSEISVLVGCIGSLASSVGQQGTQLRGAIEEQGKQMKQQGKQMKQQGERLGGAIEEQGKQMKQQGEHFEKQMKRQGEHFEKQMKRQGEQLGSAIRHCRTDIDRTAARLDDHIMTSARKQERMARNMLLIQQRMGLDDLVSIDEEYDGGDEAVPFVQVGKGVESPSPSLDDSNQQRRYGTIPKSLFINHADADNTATLEVTPSRKKQPVSAKGVAGGSAGGTSGADDDNTAALEASSKKQPVFAKAGDDITAALEAASKKKAVALEAASKKKAGTIEAASKKQPVSAKAGDDITAALEAPSKKQAVAIETAASKKQAVAIEMAASKKQAVAIETAIETAASEKRTVFAKASGVRAGATGGADGSSLMVSRSSSGTNDREDKSGGGVNATAAFNRGLSSKRRKVAGGSNSSKNNDSGGHGSGDSSIFANSGGGPPFAYNPMNFGGASTSTHPRGIGTLFPFISANSSASDTANASGTPSVTQQQIRDGTGKIYVHKFGDEEILGIATNFSAEVAAGDRIVCRDEEGREEKLKVYSVDLDGEVQKLKLYGAFKCLGMIPKVFQVEKTGGGAAADAQGHNTGSGGGFGSAGGRSGIIPASAPAGSNSHSAAVDFAHSVGSGGGIGSGTVAGGGSGIIPASAPAGNTNHSAAVDLAHGAGSGGGSSMNPGPFVGQNLGLNTGIGMGANGVGVDLPFQQQQQQQQQQFQQSAPEDLQAASPDSDEE